MRVVLRPRLVGCGQRWGWEYWVPVLKEVVLETGWHCLCPTSLGTNLWGVGVIFKVVSLLSVWGAVHWL